MGSGGSPAAIEQIATASLIPYARNARTHSEQQVQQIAGSIQEFGFCNPVLIDAQNGIIAGHGRVLAAQVLKLETVPCFRLSHLTDAQKRAYVLADNRIALSSGWDEGMLANELSDLHTDEFDMALLGFDADELAELMKLNENESAGMTAGDVIEDEVPETPDEPITKPGNLWILGNHRLLCGDSRNEKDVARLIDGSAINIAFTSPPYASQRKYDESSGFKPIHPDKFVEWFEPIASNVKHRLAADGSWFVNIKEHCEEGERHLYVKDLVCSHVRRWGWKFIDELCWVRHGFPGGFQNRFKNSFEPVFHFALKAVKFRPESVLVDAKCSEKQRKRDAARSDNSASGSGFNHKIVAGEKSRPSNVLHIEPSESLHPATFPVGLPSFFIKAYTDELDTVYEPFCGSGSTLIAAEQLNRKCFGMEISPAYCDVIVKRWENLTGKTATLEAA